MTEYFKAYFKDFRYYKDWLLSYLRTLKNGARYKVFGIFPSTYLIFLTNKFHVTFAEKQLWLQNNCTNVFLYKNRMRLKKTSILQCFFSHPSESNFILPWTWLLSTFILKNSASRTFFSRSPKNEIVGDNQARCAPSCNKSEEAIWDKWLILLLRLAFCCGLRVFNYSEGSSPISGPPSVQAIYKPGHYARASLRLLQRTAKISNKIKNFHSTI